MDLHVFWFGMLGILLAGYAILDGFDLGVGILHPFLKNDHDRRIALNSIGPLWDGNEVWLVTFGGALFAAFPPVYATVLTAFYVPFIVLLACLIGRAISIEFRSKRPSKAWRTWWDLSFFASSALAVLIMGVAVGNVLQGIPLRDDGEYGGGLLELVRPFPVIVGLLAVATAAMHGSIYLYLKTEGALQTRVQGFMWTTFGLFLVAYLGATIFALVAIPHASASFRRWPLAWIVVVLNVLAVANVPRAIYLGRPRQAFVSSCATIAALTCLLGMALFPNLVVSTSANESLTIWNASSSPRTLAIMRTIAFIGVPFVLAYTAIIYWVFRGKVRLDRFSY